MRKKYFQIITSVVLAAAVGLSGCGGAAEKPQNGSAAQPASAAQTAADSGNNAALDALLNGGNLQEAASAAESAGAAGTENGTGAAGTGNGAGQAESGTGAAAGSEAAGGTKADGGTGAAGSAAGTGAGQAESGAGVTSGESKTDGGAGAGVTSGESKTDGGAGAGVAAGESKADGGTSAAGSGGAAGSAAAAGAKNDRKYARPEIALWTDYDYVMSDDYKAVLGDYYTSQVVLTKRSVEQFPELAEGLASGVQGDVEKDRKNALKELEGAKELYEELKKDGGSFEWLWFIKDQRYVHRADESVVSFLMEGSYWTGGIHPMSYSKGVTLDTRTGKELKLTDVVSDAEKFKELIVKKLGETYDNDSFFGTPEEQIKENFQDPDMLNWVLEPQGILVRFDPYVIGPYSSGGFQVMVLFREAPEIFRPEFADPAGGYAIQMAQDEETLADLGDDGIVDHVIVSGQRDYDENMNDIGFYKSWSVSVNGQEITENVMVNDFESLLVTGSDGRNWLWIQGEDDQRYLTWFYDLNGKTPKLLKKYDSTQFRFLESVAQGDFARQSAEAEAKNMYLFSDSIDDYEYYHTCLTDPDHFLFGESPDWLWGLNVSVIVKQAKLGPDGLPKTDDGYYLIPDDSGDVEKVGRDKELTGTLVDPETFEEKGEFTVPAGALIETYATNGTDDIIYRVYDGKPKRFVKFTVGGIGTEDLTLNGVRKDDAFDYDIFNYDEADDDYENDGIRVHLEGSEENTFAPDDESFLIFTLNNMTPEITAVDGGASVDAEKMEKAVREEYDRFYDGTHGPKSVKECIKEAEKQYQNRKEAFSDGREPMQVERRTRVGWADRNIVSLLYSCIYGLHTNRYTHFVSQNLDPATGEELTLKDIAAGDPAKLRDVLVEQAEWLSRQEAYRDVEPSYMINWTERLADCIDKGQWFMEDHGITVYANEDEICPDDAGPQFFLIPFDELKGVLKEKYRRK